MFSSATSGSAATGVILAGLLAQGVRPGPHLFNEQPHFVYAIFATMMVANILCIWMCLAGAKLWSQVTLMPTTFLWPTVFVLAVVGSYSLDQSMIDVYIMLASGVLGYIMRRFDYSPVPVAMGLLLGGLAENALKQSLLIFDRQWWMFASRPIALVLQLGSPRSSRPGPALPASEPRLRGGAGTGPPRPPRWNPPSRNHRLVTERNRSRWLGWRR